MKLEQQAVPNAIITPNNGWATVRANWVSRCLREQVSAQELDGLVVFHYSIPVVLETGDGRIEEGSGISSNKFILTGGELLVSKLNPRKGCLVISSPRSELSVCSTEFVVLKPTNHLDLRFAFYLYSSEPVRQYFDSMTESATLSHQRVDPSVVSKLSVALPPLFLQRAISAFLDRKTAAIDALIEKKQKLVELLAEKRAALINQAVTKGLDPNVPMKDSGIPWIGDIPAHWEVAELRRFWDVVDCKHRTPVYLEEGYPLLSTTEVKAGKVDLTIATRFVSENDYLDMTGGGRKPSRGEVVYSRNASLGAAAYVDTDEDFAMGQDVVLIRSLEASDFSRDCEYLSRVLNSSVGMTQVEFACIGSTFKRINVGQIRQLLLPVPPPDEQQAISLQLALRTQKLDTTRTGVSRSLTRLQEYRQSLITAAVTGQLEIPEAVQ